jgi:magnesium transporter
LSNPTKQEEAAVEQWLGIGVPTREEMEEIEISSRLYVEDGAYFMTATLPSQVESDEPIMSPVTFVLRRDTLVTIRQRAPCLPDFPDPSGKGGDWLRLARQF